MFSGIRKRVTFANVAMTLALVFAMTGGAFAAGKYLITSTKQIKPSVLSQLKGKAGAQGPAGAAGATGPAGTQGLAGAVGAAGPQGPKGEAGTEGKEGKAGKDGKNGTTGFTETLPLGKTETGAWSFGQLSSETVGLFFRMPVASFAIPLASRLSGQGCSGLKGHVAETCHVHYINQANKEVITNEEFEVEEVTSADCPGSASAPTAEPGNLCVYVGSEENIASESAHVSDPSAAGTETGAATSGAYVLFKKVNAGAGVAGIGTWAVTAG